MTDIVAAPNTRDLTLRSRGTSIRARNTGGQKSVEAGAQAVMVNEGT